MNTQTKEYIHEGKDFIIVATVRHDDSCNNGHNSFAITGELYDRARIPGESSRVHTNGKRYYLGSCGCIHEDIARYFPQLAPLIKWHLCSTDGPMHYIANTTYNASDKDYNGLRKGETKPLLSGGKPGAFNWYLAALDEKGDEVLHGRLPSFVDAPEKPSSVYHCEWRQHVIEGKGKPADLEAARHCAIWPDATLEQLRDPDTLAARLPALMAEFRAAVESLGFTY